MVRRPAKVDDVESHIGAETMPGCVNDCVLVLLLITILGENVQALLDGQRGIEDDESETERKDIVAGASFEK